jgi:DNA-binding LytR/AlgR family response regulator
MNVAQEQDLYEQFEPKKDTLFFRIGAQDLISFHGRNYHIRKRISPDQRKSLFDDSSFIRVSTDCYVNVNRVTAVEDDCLFFQEKTYGLNRMPVSRKMQELIRERIEQRAQ